MKAGIFFNKKYISDNKVHVDKITAYLAANNAQCRVVEDCSQLDGLDILFVLGGDGTILNVAADCADRGIKIIGINYGHLGFLAEFEPEKLDEAIKLVCSGKYLIQKRSMLEIVSKGQKFYALNDVVLQRNTSGTHFSNTVDIRAEIDGTVVDNFSSDGIIVSTPTGSTAYSLAAGGSVLTPDLNAFILTPICAHTLHSRPIVFSDGAKISLTAVKKNRPLILAVDGRVVQSIDGGETVTVGKAEKSVEFITKNDKNFFSKLLIKLNKWSK